MERFFHYYGRFENWRGGFGRMPGWARAIVFLAALPGILLVGLSILAFLVSILALLILTVPVYRLLSVTRRPQPLQRTEVQHTPGRRHVDVTIIE